MSIICCCWCWLLSLLLLQKKEPIFFCCCCWFIWLTIRRVGEWPSARIDWRFIIYFISFFLFIWSNIYCFSPFCYPLHVSPNIITLYKPVNFKYAHAQWQFSWFVLFFLRFFFVIVWIFRWIGTAGNGLWCTLFDIHFNRCSILGVEIVSIGTWTYVYCISICNDLLLIFLCYFYFIGCFCYFPFALRNL